MGLGSEFTLKFLDVAIDHELNWGAHVKHILSLNFVQLLVLSKESKDIYQNMNILIFLTFYLCHIFRPKHKCLVRNIKIQTSKDLCNPKIMCSFTFWESNKLKRTQKTTL